MNENESPQPPVVESTPSSPSPETSPPGERFSRRTITSEQHRPATPELEKAFTTSSTIDKEGEKTLGPSAFSGTPQPYLARVLGFSTGEIKELGLGPQVNEVDDYILGLVKERNWVDTEGSYKDILEELRTNLGLHRNLDALLLLERLSKGVHLLKLQKMHRRRDAEILRAITRLNDQ